MEDAEAKNYNIVGIKSGLYGYDSMMCIVAVPVGRSSVTWRLILGRTVRISRASLWHETGIQDLSCAVAYAYYPSISEVPPN